MSFRLHCSESLNCHQSLLSRSETITWGFPDIKCGKKEICETAFIINFLVKLQPKYPWKAGSEKNSKLITRLNTG